MKASGASATGRRKVAKVTGGATLFLTLLGAARSGNGPAEERPLPCGALGDLRLRKADQIVVRHWERGTSEPGRNRPGGK
jgi:hypothetical protein